MLDKITCFFGLLFFFLFFCLFFCLLILFYVMLTMFQERRKAKAKNNKTKKGKTGK